MPRLLGIDVGTGSVKALIVDDSGNVLGRGGSEYPLSHPQPGWAEQDPSDWWASTVSAVRQAIAEAGSDPIDAIGLSGQMHGAVFLDERERPVRPAIIWADTRAGEAATRLSETIGTENLIRIAGSPVASGFQAASIAWLQEHEPDVWASVALILLPKDELRRRLTGVIASEPSDASSTVLLDVNKRDWSGEILSALNITPSMLPPIRPSGSITGELCVDAAAELGLTAGIPVSGGGADAPLSALAAGVVRANQMALTISTGSQVIVPSELPMPDPKGRIHAWSSPLEPGASGAAWYQMGATMVSGLAMRWLRDDIFALRLEGAYDWMTNIAVDAGVGAGGLVFLPYLAGERTPHMNPRARGMFLGLSADHGREHLIRAVMEGSAFALLDAFDVLRELGAKPDTIVLCGGGSRSELWRQIFADVFGLAVKPLLTVEQSALGAALTAGAAIGLFDLAEAAQAWARYDEVVEPNLHAHATYAELMNVFRAAYRSHAADFDVLTRIGERTTPQA